MEILLKKIHRFINLVLLFVLLGLLAKIGKEEDNSKDYSRDKDFEITPLSIEQVEITEENSVYFTEFDLDETYGKKVMYAVDVAITNKDSEAMYTYDYGYILFKDPDGHSLDGETSEYYTYGEEYDMPYSEVIPPHTTRNITYYVVIREDRVPVRIHIYKDYDTDEFVVMEIP